MNKTFPKIEATVYCQKAPDFDKWEIVNRNENVSLKLSGELTEIEIGSVVQKICGQTKLDKRVSPEDLITRVIENKLEDFAFIKFFGSNGAETNNGCCSNFKDWKQLKNVKTESLWFGHDPTPVFEYDKINETVLILVDDKKVGVEKERNSILFTWREYKENLQKLEEDLSEFLILLRLWTEAKFSRLAEAFVKKIKTNLGF